MNNTIQKSSSGIGLLASVMVLSLVLGLAGQALAQTATFTQRISPGETGGASQGSFVDASGNLWYDQSSGSCVISRFVPSTGAITSWTVLEVAGAAGDPGNTTGGVVVDATTGMVYFTYIDSFGIRRLDPTTAVVRSWITGFINPNSVALDAAGHPFYAASSANRIARLDPGTNVRTTWTMPTAGSFPFDIVRVPGTGVFFFTEQFGNKIGRLDPATNVITEWPVPTAGSQPRHLSLDAAGDVWFTELSGNKIGRLNPGTNVITEFAVPTAASQPAGMVGRVSGSAFSELAAKKLGRMLPSGGVSTTVTPTSTTVTPGTSTLNFFDTQQRVLNFNPTPQIDVVPGVLTPSFIEFAIPDMAGVNNFQGAPDLEATADPKVFAFSTSTGPAKVGTVRMCPPRPRPEVVIVPPLDGGPCLRFGASISDPLNEPLSGVVRVLEVTGPATIDALTFTVLNTSCGSPDVFEFFLNGISLGTFPGDPNFTCACSAPQITYTITNASLLANWQQGANTFRFTKSGTNQTGLAWVKVDIQFPSGSATACVFDEQGGNCDVADLCNANFTFGPVDASQTVNISADVEVLSETYTNSTLPCSIDITSLTVGNSYVLAITANVDEVSGNDRQAFVYNGETVLSINECGCTGSVAGQVTADCPVPNTGLLGVSVDAFEQGTGNLVGTAVTDANGNYQIDDLAAVVHTITIVTPLGYSAVTEDVLVTIVGGGTVTADFALTCLDITAEPRTIGFWKHQVGVATGGKGRAQVDAATLCDYLDLITDHFNTNAMNQVIIYLPPASGLCPDKLDSVKALLNLKGNVGMTARAKQQLMALLLNVASGKLSLTEIISADGATVSQAITYADNLIDDPGGDHETAKTVCDEINNNRQVASGVIPLTTPDIAYRVIPEGFSLHQNYPNPFNAGTIISYALEDGGLARLEIFDILGRSVITLVDGVQTAGLHQLAWNGTDRKGRTVSSGMYFYRLTTGDVTVTKKMLLLK